jgi:GNAT superfamily N-acetyltransferase
MTVVAAQDGQNPFVFIRDRSPHDGPALEALALRTHRLDGYPKYLPEDLRSFIVDAGALGAWVATSGGEVIGHVALHPSSVRQVMDLALAATNLDEGSIAVVARLLVAPTARRHGVGRALLQKATEESAGLGRRAVLDVVEDHRAAIRLYEACGWAQVGRVDWALPGGLPLREFVYISPDANAEAVAEL